MTKTSVAKMSVAKMSYIPEKHSNGLEATPVAANFNAVMCTPTQPLPTHTAMQVPPTGKSQYR